ncbi:MarR family winged helix-turn-helix transcriptional regulator [Sphingomonas sp. 1P06PA]|uniref:MarR family winged helix-turn-helix transcriptional regulator n=1 Tax=Sphingomonas sp. 1P06PA TaxID=554121 RepID=UPI0039A60576
MADRSLVLEEFIPFRLSYTSNIVSDRIAAAYETLFGLRIPEWRLIAVVAEQGAITQQQIGEKTRMDKVTVSRAAIALADRGLIERAPNAADRRSHLLRLTAAGGDLYASVAPKALELEARIFDRFDVGELAAFVTMLRRIDAVALAMGDSA